MQPIYSYFVIQVFIVTSFVIECINLNNSSPIQIFLYVFKTFRLRCQGIGFFEAKLTSLLKENTVIQILLMVSTSIFEMNGKNGQVFNSLIVFLASNYEQLAITFFLTRNQKSLTSVLTNHAHRKINSFSTPFFWQQTELYIDYYSSKGKLLLILYLKQINSRYKNVA